MDCSKPNQSLDLLSYKEAQSFPLCCTVKYARNVKYRKRHKQMDGERERQIGREEINVELAIRI